MSRITVFDFKSFTSMIIIYKNSDISRTLN